ncbi:DUF2750 domain-containing protein [Bacillus sp. AFS031507]|uniref:DUF2750 domain-containing protein n=1 Tax=Bacillus sp. AFS031507 TaxID=2033496 RepID=UPI000BFB2BFC|nr:DUF2750 domain-containing protein [Bacillus sp. AFS031507]PGY03477.1 hypothetical protein COE25_29615 [Bacillus sp. AFS031507]
MNQKEFDSVIKQPPNIRYEYFIKKVADYEELWGLYDDGWATAQDDDGNMLIPFFPKKEFAEYCAVNKWNKFKAEPIDIYEFIDKWLVGMKKDRVKPSIFPSNEDSVMVEIDVLLRDLNNELENY